MAIWMQVIGKRNLTSLEFEKNYLAQILKKIDLSFFTNSQNEDVWNLNKREGMEFFEYRFSAQSILDSVRITFNNPEFIDLSGPFNYFSAYYKFVDFENMQSTEEWRRVFKEIAIAYGINDLYYFCEDFFPLEFIYDGESNANELFTLFENAKRSDKLYDLNYNEYFVEPIVSH
ncbi:hypothetical protein [Flavobacterium aestuarii]|uniref:hypothetical protein n=1 Tax=Flavobacterium aestuarii TaxID=3149227 RepID=UPI0032B43970